MRFQRIRRNPPQVPAIVRDAAKLAIGAFVFVGIIAAGLLYLNLLVH